MLRPAEPSAHPSPAPPTSEPTGHTPGEWSIDGRSRVGEIRVVSPYTATCSYQIALVSPDSPDDATCAANARLIAAAPDLLAACKGLLDAIHDSMTHESQAFHAEQINAAKAAIAKAKAGGVAHV